MGYAAPHTLAGQLKNGEKNVRIFGQEFEVKANIQSLESFSAHGDYNEMIDFLSCQDASRVEQLFLVHGEYDTQLSFKLKLQREGFERIHIPSLHERVVV